MPNMSNKSKFQKLQLPKSSRLKTNPQISNFFSTSNNEENSSLLSELSKTSASQLLENSNENSTNSWLTQDIVLIVSDDEDDTLQSNNKPSSPKAASNEKIKKSVLKTDRKTEQLNNDRKTVVSKFFNNKTDFENPPVTVKPNKVIKPKSTKSSSMPKTKRKRQTTIKSAFIKNEEIFSKLMAQHSIVDDINPDDLQMALAMSMSEATANGILQDEDSKKSVACCSGNSNTIRDRLQEYGFKTNSNSSDYDLSYFLVGKKKTKWANKFTALTLRNPERQKEKLNNQIEKFLRQQELLPNKSNSINNINTDYLISSNYLNKLKSDNVSIKLELDDSGCDSADMFYVDELFERSLAKIGHLMKDLNTIPGRDFSPKKSIIKKKLGKSLCENASNKDNEISEEESTISKSNEATMESKNFNISELPSLLEENDRKWKTIKLENNVIENGIIKMSESLDMDLEIEQDILLSPEPKKPKIENGAEQLCNENIKDNSSSPDLFADYEAEISKDKIENELLYKTNKNSSHFEPHITSFENFSSDEVKTGNNINDHLAETDHSSNISIIHTPKATSMIDEELIDLTQDIKHKIDSTNSTSYNLEENSFENLKNDVNSFRSQRNITQDDSIDDCIILSDDEVNYSIKIANKTINYNKSIDLTLSTCSNIEEDRKEYSKTENYDENSIQNFSFISLIEDIEYSNESVNLNINEKLNLEDNKNISYLEILEENEYGEITPTQSPFKQELTSNENSPTKTIPNQNSKAIASTSSFNEFLSPIKITPKTLFRNQSRFSKYSNHSEKMTNNSSRKLNFTLAENSMCNKNSQTDSEDDEMCFDLTKLRTKFGIKEVNMSNGKSVNSRKTLSESFISPIKDNLKLKRFSSGTKFKEFIETDEYFSDTDEIDKLVYGNQLKTSLSNRPHDIDKLLTADLKTKPSISTNSGIIGNETSKEITSNGRTYLVKTENIPEKPDYKRMDSPTRLKELYKYGLKPLKKKQAVIMLEYIYNQTHPSIVNDSSQLTIENFTEPNREVINKQNNIINIEITKAYKIHTNDKFAALKLRDCFGNQLLEDDGFMFGEKEDEIFIFQTNISKKIFTALLPLHVAWYNLIKSNYRLKESILHYEPIDLQEIYLHFKGIGYRYDPKDIKKFFDKHCIIFRYDLNQDANANRHLRKKKSSFTISQKSK